MKCVVFAEFSTTGGTRSFLKDLLTIHEKHNISTEVVFPKSASDNDIINYIESKNFSYITVPDRKPIFKKSYFSLIYELYYYYSIIAKVQPDLIVVSTATPGENIFCFLSDVPSVYILHTPVNPTTFINSIMLKIPTLYSGARRQIYAVSEFVKQSVVKHWNIKDQDVNVIYNSYRLNNSMVNSPAKPKVVLTLGHVIGYKNPSLWLEIAQGVTEAVEDVEFLWLGDGDMLCHFQEITKDSERINFVGHKNNVGAYYQTAYLYLQPSLKESLGISVLDAMSLGIPTIVSRAEGLPETTEHGVSGYICETNEITEYIEYIRTLLQDDDLRKRMGANAKKRTGFSFSPQVQEEKIIDLYRSVTGAV